MTDASSSPPRSWLDRALAPVWCAAAVLVAYSNCPPNAFALDDWHSIVQNPWVRSLRNIPRYFVDPNTFTILPANRDLRPLLQTTYALNYALSQRLFGDGYDPRTWHGLNMALHFTVVLSLFFLGRRLMGSGGLAPVPGLEPKQGDQVALAAALLFAVHPITSGCVNYISARSSLLVAALVLPALVLYLRAVARGSWPAFAGALVLYGLALFTKIEAVSLLGVVVLAELLLTPEPRAWPWKRWPLAKASTLRLLAFGLATAAFGAFWISVSPLKENAVRSIPGVTPGIYLLTEVRAWWYYLGEVAAPVHLVADESAYPISGVPLDPQSLPAGEPLYSLTRAALDPRAWLAIAAWLLVGIAAVRALPRTPLFAFLLGAFFLFLVPHSSVVPLAEMVNEHRPYLPVAGLFLVFTLGLFRAVSAVTTRTQLGLGGAVVILAIPLTALTRERNAVWLNDLTLWGDTAAKSPDSARAQMNYGLALMSRGRYPEAEARFRRSLALAPNYSYAHVNLAIVQAAQGNDAAAAVSYDTAVSLAPSTGDPYYWRGLFRAKRGQTLAAISDFQQANQHAPNSLQQMAALVESLIQAGRGAEAHDLVAGGERLDAPGFLHERESFRATYGRR